MRNSEEATMPLFAYDRQLRLRGGELLCGVDEAGRGPLAGPVVAAAVILPPQLGTECLPGLGDSKKLTEKRREALYEPILNQALAWGIGQASCQEIDEQNILNATFVAMRRAVEQLTQRLGRSPSLVLVDGNRDPGLGLPTCTVVKGDGASASIAAASVLAKVTRDRILLELDSQYPQYAFAKHKGYPTREHYRLLEEHGACPQHRRSFLKRWEAARRDDR